MLKQLVPLSGISTRIKVEPYYYKRKLVGTHNECYVRSEVAAQLIEASSYLPVEVGLLVWDGWRSYETQRAIYEETKKGLMNKGFLGEALKIELAKYVAKPTKNIQHPSPHLSGGAIDLTLFTANGILPMGSDFDEFHERSQLNYFEGKQRLTEQEKMYSNNRRLLKHAMVKAGFISNPDEWWHYEYGTKSWASNRGIDQYFKGVLAIDC